MKIRLTATMHFKETRDGMTTRESMLFVNDYNLGEEEREANTIHALENNVKWFADRLKEEAQKRIKNWSNPHGAKAPNGYRITVYVPRGERKIRGFNKSKILSTGLDVDL